MKACFTFYIISFLCLDYQGSVENLPKFVMTHNVILNILEQRAVDSL